MVRRITDTLAPKTLFKYRDWTNENHRKLITKQEIYFPKPSDFNDPFDGNIPVRWDLLTYQQCLEKNLEFVKIVNKSKNQKLLRKIAKKITDEKKLWHPNNIARERPEQLEKWNSIIGLLSLSSVPDNILMWSHYSLNHTGFVVGLDTNSLQNDYDFDYLEPINYQSEYPLISGLDDTTTQFHKKFFYKSDLWSYEKEWRISKNHIDNRVIQLRPETITQIIIGCCASSEQVENVTKLVRENLLQTTSIFKANRIDGSFGINLTMIH